jgi:hypothetical protein
LILNTGCYFIASKLQSFQKSKTTILLYLLNLVYTIFLTIFVFGFINYALHKIDPSSFQTFPNVQIIHFFYYSFNTIFTNGINDFFPISMIARFINSVEIFFGFLILIILFFLLTTIQRDKHNEELDQVVDAMGNQGEELEKFIESQYKLDFEKSIKLLQEIESDLVQIVIYLLRNID